MGEVLVLEKVGLALKASMKGIHPYQLAFALRLDYSRHL